MANKTEATLLLKIQQAGEEALKTTASALANIGKVAVAAFTDIAAVVAIAIHSYREQEEATNALNRSMINNGIYTKDLAKEYDEMASALEKVTTYSDDNITKGQAVLQQYLGHTKITKDLVAATLDFATAQKMDLAQAAEMVGKTIGTSTNALARQGIQVDETASKNEKLTQVIQALSVKFGGQAEAAAEGLGVLAQLKNSFANVAEAVGKRLSPGVIALSHDLLGMSNSLEQNERTLNGIVQATQGVSSAIIVLKHVILGVTGTLSGGIATGLEAGKQALSGFSNVFLTQFAASMGKKFESSGESISGGFKKAVETIKSNGKDLLTDIKDRNLEMYKELDTVAEAFADRATEREERNDKENRDKKIAGEQELNVNLATLFTIRSADELARVRAQEMLKTDIKYLQIQRQLANLDLEVEKSGTNQGIITERIALETAKRKMYDDAYSASKIKNLDGLQKIEEVFRTEQWTKTEQALNQLSALQNSKHKELKEIGKAAAIASIAMDTASGAMKAYAGFAWIPFVGPALGIAAAGVVVAYGAERAANVTALAEGGIVQARPGGTQALIGEAGQDEAVIPLEDGQASGMLGGTNVTVNVYGGLLGSPHEARQLAVAIDQELLKLRRSNQSVSMAGVL